MNKKVKIMGILNVTPDSFSDGGEFNQEDDAVLQGLKLQEQGADILDIGGESSRPGASFVLFQEELERVESVVKRLHSILKIPMSIDTVKPQVAKVCIESGVSFLNDISGFKDPEMVEIAAHFGVDICCMHMQGTPKSMQISPYYEKGIIPHLLNWMEETAERLLKAGVSGKKIIFDPGIGFGKTVDDNLQIIHNLPKLRSLGYPLLIGASRKSFMTQILGKSPKELVSATVAVHILAALGGADYVRVHDVEAHVDALTMISRIAGVTKFGG